MLGVLSVEIEKGQAGGKQGSGHAGRRSTGDDGDRAGVGGDPGVPIAWMIGVERHIATAGRKHRQQRSRIARFMRQEDRDRSRSSGGRGGNRSGQAIHHRRELGIGERAVHVADREVGWIPTHDGVEPLDDRPLQRSGGERLERPFGKRR